MKKSTNVTTAAKVAPLVTLDEIVASTLAAATGAPGSGLCRATVRARREDGTIEVALADQSSVAFVCDVLDNAEMLTGELREGDEVVVMASSQGQQRGCVLGRVRRGAPASFETGVPETLLIEAGRELVLRVGEGSITIRADGKILIKGRDLVSHATRMNRIRGGSVSLN